MLNTRQIQVFCAVMETGSVSDAARTLHISQPAISKSLRLLEETLGFPLFRRVGARLHPSIEAQRLYPSASRVFEELAATTDLAKQLRSGDAGKLTVAAAYTLAVTLMPEAIREFLERKSLIDLQFMASAPRQIVDLVLEHEIDLGFAYEPVTDAALERIPICEAEMVCLLPKGHHLEKRSEIHVCDLQTHKIISYSEDSHAGTQLRRNCAAEAVPWSTAIEVNQTQAALSLVKADVGIGVVDPFAVIGQPSGELTIRPFRPRTVLDCHAIYANDRPASQILFDFVDSLLTIAARHRDDLPAGVMAITSSLSSKNQKQLDVTPQDY